MPPQERPAAVSALEAAQIDILKVRNLTNLSIGLPNVQLDDLNIARGVAHFSIRGLGANSSLPAVGPSVGLFVDGVYVGTSVTALHDVYDLEAIEVLRGPQNTQFGRSTVGGAVRLETRQPTDFYEATVRSAVEGGGKAPNVYVSGTLNAPLTETLGVRLTVYSNQDQGWFENEHDGRAHGAQDYVSLRPVLSWQPTRNLDLTLRYEYQDGDGDGPAVQNRLLFDRDSHDFAIAQVGYNRAEARALPRAPTWTYSLGVQHTLALGARHRLISRANYAYRDKSYDTADNQGFNRQQKIVDAGMDLLLDDGRWVIGVYGRNLLGFARAGADTPVSPAYGGGTLAPLARGRTFGLELTYNFRGV